MKKFGLIGAGGYAAGYVNRFLKKKAEGEIEFAGIVIRPQDRSGVASAIAELENAGIPIYPDKEALFDSVQLDLLALPVAIGSHCPLTLDALQRKINVIVEKPAAGSLAEVDRMIGAEQQSGKFVAVGFQHTHAPDVQKLKTMLLEGKFGRIRRITVMGRWPRADQYYRRNNWVCKLRGSNGEPVYDSPINNAFAHYLNLCLFLSGDTFDKSAHAIEMQAELYRARRGIETFDSCAARLHTASGTEAVCLFTHTCPDNVNPLLRIECDRAVINWAEMTSWTAEMTDGTVINSGMAPSSGYDDMLKRLIERVEGKNPFMCTLEIAREQTFVIENLHKHFTVTELPEDEFSICPEDGQHIIHNIDRVFDECYAQSKLPSETDVRWAKAGQIVNLNP